VFTAVTATDSAPSDVVTQDRCFVTDPKFMGYNDGKRGWFDVSGCGVCNDYCRNVGSASNIFFSCKLAGQTAEYTPRGYSWGTPDNVFTWPMCSGKGAPSTESAASVPTYSPSNVPSAQVSTRSHGT
jgi:hypothetical protein